MKKTFIFKVQSNVDVITNSSTEIFVIKEKDKELADIINMISSVIHDEDMYEIHSNLYKITGEEKYYGDNSYPYELRYLIEEIINLDSEAFVNSELYKAEVTKFMTEFYNKYKDYIEEIIGETTLDYFIKSQFKGFNDTIKSLVSTGEVYDMVDDFYFSLSVKYCKDYYILPLDNNSFYGYDGLYKLSQFFPHINY
ncbi:MAG: hypothetical protein RSC92_01775 [Clostridia bacterium]